MRLAAGFRRVARGELLQRSPTGLWEDVEGREENRGDGVKCEGVKRRGEGRKWGGRMHPL